ncbi:MAG: hypothetical protein ABII74_04655 [Elusimicrobiota bacterium]
MRYSRYFFVSSLVTVFLFACATPAAYYQNLNNLVAGGNYSQAASLAEKSKEDAYGEKNALLYYLDRGMLLHLAGNYEESNLALEKAKKLAEEYFTKSVTAEAVTFLVSDNTRPYYGEDFERTLTHIFSALNYIFLGQESEALVEARQVDHFLKTLRTNYGYKAVYKEDAFAGYLMGMIYENQNQINEAFISYRQALDAYENYQKNYTVSPPNQLVGDALRTAKLLGFREEIEEIRNKWKTAVQQLADNNSSGGELVIVNYNGFSPVKIDNFFEIGFGQGWAYVANTEAKGDDQKKVEQAGALARSIAADEQVRMAFPKYVPVNYQIKKVEAREIKAGEGSFAAGSLAEDIGAIAEKSLEDRINRVRAKTIARAVLRFVLARKVTQSVEKSNNELTTWLVKKAFAAASAVIEQADKRSWQSLPDKIFIIRLPMSEGKHSVQLNFLDQQGSIIKTQVLDNIRIKAGKKTFVTVRTAM